MTDTINIWGIIAEYDSPERLIEAAEKAKKAGYKKLDAYTPIPVEGLSDALGQKKTKIQWLILLAGIAGAVGGFFMQYYANVIDYPWNIGGRPLNSWPAFMPITFELTVLSAAFMAVFGMFALCGFPEPYHPLFNVDAFDGASRDKFFLCITAEEDNFELQHVKQFLETLNPDAVHEVKS